MGKKPVVALAGLIWAGMLAAGCGECCRSNNTRKGCNPPPMMSKNVNGGQPQGGLVSDKDAPPLKPGDGAERIVPASAPGKQISANVPADGTAPLTQHSLQPKQTPGFASGVAPAHEETVIGRSVEPSMKMPAPPFRTTESSQPGPAASNLEATPPAGGSPLPEYKESSKLPARPSMSLERSIPGTSATDGSHIPPPPPQSK